MIINGDQLEIGQYVYVQSFKHDKTLHRTWAMAMVIENNDQYLCLVTNKSWVSESNGRIWLTREPALWFFYPDCWYNICAMIRKDGIYYYCNLASPSLYDGEAVKYIDYDLDIKLFPDGRYILLDKDEYIVHGDKMNYSQQLKDIIENQTELLKKRIEEYQKPFDDNFVLNQYDKYLNIKNIKEKC